MTDLDKQTNANVRRLLDMVVEEVSLVDRPANQRRFLITKRSDNMSTKTKKNASSETTREQAENQSANEVTLPDDINAEQAVESNDKEILTGGQEDPGGGANPTVQALDQMADAVATLSASGNEELLQGLGQKMRELADTLSPPKAERAIGTEPMAESQVKKQIAQYVLQADRSEALMNALHQTLTSLNSKLEPLGSLIASMKEWDSRRTPQNAAPAGRQKSSEEKIQTLTKAMTSLTEVIREQRQRVARMEKSFGLPNSLPRNEGNSKNDESGGWPLDLNSPVDRNSIDRSVSFHDV